MRQCDRFAIKTVQCAWTKWIVGISSNLVYKIRFLVLNLEPLWLPRAKENLLPFSSLISGNSCFSTPRFTDQIPYSLQSIKLVVTTDISKTSNKINIFIVKHSSLENLLPQQVRFLSSSNTTFKNEVPKL